MSDTQATHNSAAQLSYWFENVDDFTEGVFETLYRQHFDVLKTVIDCPDLPRRASLKEALEQGEGTVSLFMINEEVVATPFHAQENQEVEVTWVETMTQGAAVDSYATVVEVQDAFGQPVWETRLDRGPLEMGGSAPGEATWPGSAEAGTFSIYVHVNADGGDHTAPTQSGIRGLGVVGVQVGTSEDMASNQDNDAWIRFAGTLSGAAADLANFSTDLADAGNYLAMLEGLSPTEQQLAADIATHAELAQIDGIADRMESWSDLRVRILGAVQVATPESEQSREPVITPVREFIDALVRASQAQ